MKGNVGISHFDDHFSYSACPACEEYDHWRYHYPNYDETRISVQVPPDILNMPPLDLKRGRKLKKK